MREKPGKYIQSHQLEPIFLSRSYAPAKQNFFRFPGHQLICQLNKLTGAVGTYRHAIIAHSKKNLWVTKRAATAIAGHA